MKKTVGIRGADGFIGGEILPYLKDRGYSVFKIARNFKPEDIAAFDVVINLAGAPINAIWTKSYKAKMIGSRIDTTRRLVEGIKNSKREMLLINASAVGIYKSNENIVYTEESFNYGDGFLSQLCKDWEEEALKADFNCRVVLLRLGVVMGENGGALQKLALSAKFGFSTVPGSGEQVTPWIMIDDLKRAINYIIENNQIYGAVNLTAPTLITASDVAREISKKYKTLLTLRVPAILFKLVLGEASSVLLDSHKVIPKKLIDNGFIFNLPNFSLKKG